VKVVLDTNRYRDFCEGEPHAVAICRRAERIGLPYVVLAELRAGFRCGTKGTANEQVLVRFLNKPRVEVLYPDESTTFVYAELYRQLRVQGTPIPTNDLWIGSLTVQHDRILCSRDGHFHHLPQIPVV